MGRVIAASSNFARRKELCRILEQEGYETAESSTADEALRDCSAGEHDLVILDAGIQGIGTYDLCRTIRAQSGIGIILLRQSEHDLPASDALNAGADDYLRSPFVMTELLARVRALLRRLPRSAKQERPIVLADRSVDLNSRSVLGPHEQLCRLTPREFSVLTHLLARVDSPITHQSLAQAVWQRNVGGDFEYVRVVIQQLRRKLEVDPEHPRYILTERGVGYRLRLT